MQYRRAHLEGHTWHKIVLNRGSTEHKRCGDWLRAKLPDDVFMVKGVSGHYNIWISNLEDFVLARLALNFTTTEMRGAKEWVKVMDQRDKLFAERQRQMWARAKEQRNRGRGEITVTYK